MERYHAPALTIEPAASSARLRAASNQLCPLRRFPGRRSELNQDVQRSTDSGTWPVRPWQVSLERVTLLPSRMNELASPLPRTGQSRHNFINRMLLRLCRLRLYMD